MSKHIKEKLLLNCGRKRKMKRQEAESQLKARKHSNPNRPIKVYECNKCHTWHTTTARSPKIDWGKL